MSDVAEKDVYSTLAQLWSGPVWGWMDHLPGGESFQKMLKENLSEEEARALLDVPVKPVPLDFTTLDEIAADSSLPREELERILDGIAARGLLWSRVGQDGKKAYAILKSGYGYSQTFYWKGEKTPFVEKMLELERDRELLSAYRDLYTTVETKAYRYIPTTEAIDPQWQNVYPTETIEKVIEKATKIALAHCPCRVSYEMRKGKSCGHSTDVCVKLNSLAEAVINAGLAREITHEEALEVIRKADREGLVHFTDNAADGMLHICNCCGDACWNVRPIRLRQVPRDMLMATYFLRETDEDECTGCETCVDICPVAAVKIEDGVARVDTEWCIGCGVCVPRCPSDAIKLVEKEKKPVRAASFAELHTRINKERAARGKGAETS